MHHLIQTRAADLPLYEEGPLPKWLAEATRYLVMGLIPVVQASDIGIDSVLHVWAAEIDGVEFWWKDYGRGRWSLISGYTGLPLEPEK